MLLLPCCHYRQCSQQSYCLQHLYCLHYVGRLAICKFQVGCRVAVEDLSRTAPGQQCLEEQSAKQPSDSPRESPAAPVSASSSACLHNVAQSPCSALPHDCAPPVSVCPTLSDYYAAEVTSESLDLFCRFAAQPGSELEALSILSWSRWQFTQEGVRAKIRLK